MLNTTTYPPSIIQAPITNPAFTTNTLAALQQAYANLPGSTEFQQGTWRSLLSALGKINLNRTLQDYPVATTTTPWTGANLTTAQNAILDRQKLATDIFTALQQATGAFAPAAVDALPATVTTKQQQKDALRYLAQVAVNIVDYIDADDYSTAFNWVPNTTISVTGHVMRNSNTITFTGANNTSSLFVGMTVTGASIPANTTIVAVNSATSITISQNATATRANDALAFTDLSAWVYGLETPRLVINEVYAQFDTYAAAPSFRITGASNTSPIVITTTASTTGLVSGQMVEIKGVLGNTGANGFWSISNVTATGFSLTGSSGTGNYTANSGTWTGSFNANFWVELYNPFPTTASYGTAPNNITDNPTYSTDTTAYVNSSIYQLLIINNQNAPVNVATQLQNQHNVLGTLPSLVLTGHTTRNGNTITGLASTNNLYVGMTVTGTGIPNVPPTTITGFSSPTSITISQDATANSPAATGVSLTVFLPSAISPLGTVPINPSSYYVLGPTAPGYAVVERPATVVARTNDTIAQLSIPASNPTAPPPILPLSIPPQPTLLLQRLLNPCLPLNTTITSPLYNPYVTVDYVDGIKTTDATAVAAAATGFRTFASQGRKQPWTGNILAPQTSGTGPLHTFGKINDNAPASYDWLVHLDRSLISKAELLGVPYCKPHELTQLFLSTPPALRNSTSPPGSVLRAWFLRMD